MASIFSVLIVSVFVSVSMAQTSFRTTESDSKTDSSKKTVVKDTETLETERTLEELRRKAEARKRGQSTTTPQTPTRVNKNPSEVKTVEENKPDTTTPPKSTTPTDSNESSTTSTSDIETLPNPSDIGTSPPVTIYPFGVFLNYSLLDLVVPSKYGVSGYVDYRGHQIEAEYLTGSLSVPLIITDIGEIKDTRFTVRVRSFTKNRRFNWFWGVTYFAFDARLGAELLNTVTPGQAFPDYDVAEHRALGFDIGIGHRWELAENFVFGVDWISWSQPLTTFKKDAPFLAASAPQEVKDRVDKAIGLLTYVPRFSVAKISIGYVF